MARKLKHSKIKNTGILFELLTRQITADVLAGKSTKSVGILKKYFNENTELGKELELYKLLSEKNYTSEVKANDLLNVVIKQRQKLSNSNLRREKYNLISSIKENYNVTDFFNGRIPNYRILASIYNVFQSETTSEKFKADHIVNSRFTVLEHITHKKVDEKQIKEKVLKEYNKEDMTDEQRSLFDDLLALQQRCIEIEPMAREFADKKQLVDLKSQSLLESLRGIGNAEKESDSETKIID